MPLPAPVTSATLLVAAMSSSFCGGGMLFHPAAVAAKEIEKHAVEALGLLEVGEVACALEDEELGPRNSPRELLRELGRIHGVLFPGDDQGRRGDVLDWRRAVLAHRSFERFLVRGLVDARHAVEELLVGGIARSAAEDAAQALRGIRAALVDELLYRVWRHRIEARVRADEHERAHSFRRRERHIARHASAHRKTDEVKLFRAEVHGHAQHVAREIVEGERPFAIIRIAVAARVGRGDSKLALEVLDLPRPVAAVTADAVKKKDEFAVARDRHREPRRRIDEKRVQELLRLGSRDSDRASAVFAVFLKIVGKLFRRADDDLVALLNELFLPELGLFDDALRVLMDARHGVLRRAGWQEKAEPRMRLDLGKAQLSERRHLRQKR